MTSTDYVPALLEGGRAKATAEHLPVTFQQADAEDLPFADDISQMTVTKRFFVFRYRSAEHWLDVFRTYYGPVLKAFAALDGEGQAGLARDLTDLLERFNTGRSETLTLPSEYLEVVATRYADVKHGIATNHTTTVVRASRAK